MSLKALCTALGRAVKVRTITLTMCDGTSIAPIAAEAAIRDVPSAQDVVVHVLGGEDVPTGMSAKVPVGEKVIGATVRLAPEFSHAVVRAWAVGWGVPAPTPAVPTPAPAGKGKAKKAPAPAPEPTVEPAPAMANGEGS